MPCLVVALALAMPSCAPAPSGFFYEERFESLCSGVPCGWTVGAGPVGSVLWVETLPGEHGLALHGDRVAVLGPVDGIETPDTSSPLDGSRLAAFLGARCDPGADLEIEISVSDLITGRIDSFRGTVVPGATWDDGPSTTRLSPVGSTASGAFFRDVVALRILKSGPGVCVVDELAITSTFAF